MLAVHLESGRPSPPRGIACAFTIIELLVVVGILSLVLSILLPALAAVRSSAKSLVCSSNLKSATVEFTLFADGTSGRGRGDSDQLGNGRFRIEDFQESLYQISEFWDRPGETFAQLESGANLMLCPASAKVLTRRSGFPCSSAAIDPASDVSLAFNMRLHRASVEFKGKRVLAPVASTFIRPEVLRHPYAPLLFDVDGPEAARRVIEPFYAAPSVPGMDDAYSEGAYWFPSNRHHGKTNVGFVGGHVLTSESPALERWEWSYQASAGR